MALNLQTTLGPLLLKNPIILASGTAGYGSELKAYININKLGGFVTKTITLHPRIGNPVPRIVETASGIVNSIGLENPGLEKFCQDYLPHLTRLKTIRIVSIGAEKPPEFLIMAKKLSELKGIDALEVNISCPNIQGRLIAQSPTQTYEVVKKIRKKCSLPLIVKLSPAVTDIVSIARSAISAGADIISLINTIPALVVDWRTQKSFLGTGRGGLSGPAIKPIALKMVWEVAQGIRSCFSKKKSPLPIIGMGGIMTGTDVLEFLVAGAAAVGIGTANLIDPTASVKILQEVRQLLLQQKIYQITSLIGSLKIGST